MRHAAPESAMRVAVLEAEASLRLQLIAVQKEQNGLMVQAYRDGMNTPRVSAARRAGAGAKTGERSGRVVFRTDRRKTGKLTSADDAPALPETDAPPLGKGIYGKTSVGLRWLWSRKLESCQRREGP